MKRRSLILVGFLVVLFMIPMSFSNVSAIAYEYSPESIEEFNETLPSDVLFYPDAIEPQITDGNVSGAETNNYTATYVNDATTWQNFAQNDDLYTYFDINGSFPVDTMHLEIDAIASGPIATHTLILYLYNPQGADLLVASDTGVGAGDAVLNGWYNVTAWGSYEYDSKHTFYLFTSGSVNPTTIVIDYFRLSFMTGASQADPVLSDPYFATGGDTGFANTYAVDASNFSVDGVLEFGYPAYNFSSLVSFTYAIYGISAGSTFVHYSNDDVDYGSGPFDVITSEGWYNGTYNTALGALENTGTGYVWFATNSESSINYMEISFTYIPLSAYGESFSDVSDWDLGIASGTTGVTFTTDGDVLDFRSVFDDAGNEYTRYDYNCSDSISFVSGYYLEFRYKVTTANGVGRVRLYDSGSTERNTALCEGLVSLDWVTVKIPLTNFLDDDTKTIDQVRLYIDDSPDAFAGGAAHFYLDYLRIGPSDEMGWQHDGSNILGTALETDASWTSSVSTDGDILTYDAERLNDTTADAYLSIGFYCDPTSSSIGTIDTDYYPFLAIRYRIVSSTNIDLEYVTFYDEKRIGNTYMTSTTWTTLYINQASAGAYATSDDRIIFYAHASASTGSISVEFEYLKAYSIANFSYDDGGGESANDYSYVASNGSLIIHTDTYTKWNYDPTLSVTIATYGLWSASITNGSEYFRFRELLDTNTLWDQGITNGSLVGTTFEDFDILIYGPCTISSFNFYGIVPSWNIITTVEIVFWVAGWQIISSIIIVFATEISTYTLNLLFLFLGLAMIPASTIFFVKGGRDEMSRDKLLVVILCFFMGWALFLGGIFA